MRLYQDKELFSQIVNKISKEKGINEAIIEKDYFNWICYVFFFVKRPY